MKALLSLMMILSSASSFAMVDTIRLSSLEISAIKQDFGSAKIDRSVMGNPLRIAGTNFEHGVGTHAGSTFTLSLQKQAFSFTGLVGIDEGIFPEMGSAEFLIISDGQVLWRSGIMNRTMQARSFSVDLTNRTTCELLVFDGNDNIFSDHANWVNAYFIVNKGFKPIPFIRPIEEEYVLTPSESLLPMIHGKTQYGAKPGSDIMHYVPVSGLEPLSIIIDNLPPGLTFDSYRRIIKGSIEKSGTYSMTIRAENALGKAQSTFLFRIGDTISFSPPIGWSSWYAHWEYVTQEDMYKAAHALRNSGLQQYGFEYVLIDDGWQDTSHALSKEGLKPAHTFPDLEGMIDSLHSMGFKVGIYSSPGSHTCVKLPGSLNHEEQDAAYFCSIKADLVKHDWCGYQTVYDSLMKSPGANPTALAMAPYAMMGNALQRCNRDIFYMVCQYGNNDVWKWGRSIGGHSWRTTTDIQDNWWSMSNIVGFRQAGLEQYAGHNGWNDMDHLRLGYSQPGRYMQKTRLTPHEQYTQVSLWALLNSPLILSMHMDSLDGFTLQLLKNHEVLAMHQDPLGIQGRRVYKNIWQEIWSKPLMNGGLAIGLFNRDDVGEQTLAITRNELGVNPDIRYTIRDLWTQKDIGYLDQQLQYTIPSHGVRLIALIPESPLGPLQEEEPISSCRIIPQPAIDIAYCSFYSSHQGQGLIEIIDANGSLIGTSISIDIKKGMQAFTLPLPQNMASGLYGLKISSGFSTVFHPILIVH